MMKAENLAREFAFKNLSNQEFDEMVSKLQEFSVDYKFNLQVSKSERQILVNGVHFINRNIVGYINMIIK